MLLLILWHVSMKYEDWENEEYEFFWQGLDYAESIDGAAFDYKKALILFLELLVSPIVISLPKGFR